MSKLGVLIVDDEPLAAERLADLVAALPSCQVLAQANNAQQALQAIQQHRPDVVLLDISMPGTSGLAFAKTLKTLSDPPFIIFCTAYEQHALQAFEAQAIDYLVKPVRRERLHESLMRVVQLKKQATEQREVRYVTASVAGVWRRISLADIFYLHAEEKYTVVYHRGGQHVLDEALKDLEQRFTEQFLRIHRNCLIHSKQLREIQRDAEGRYWAVLKDCPKILEISRRCASELKEYFKHHIP